MQSQTAVKSNSFEFLSPNGVKIANQQNWRCLGGLGPCQHSVGTEEIQRSCFISTYWAQKLPCTGNSNSPLLGTEITLYWAQK